MKSFAIALVAGFTLLSWPAVTQETDESHISQTNSGVEITDVWARKTRRTMSAAVYLTLNNSTEHPDTLLAATTPRASMTTLHMSGEVDGIMRMEMQDEVALPAGQTVEFAPGGLHIMLMGLSEPLAEGTTFPLTLTLEKAGEITVNVNVTGLSGPATNHH